MLIVMSRTTLAVVVIFCFAAMAPGQDASVNCGNLRIAGPRGLMQFGEQYEFSVEGLSAADAERAKVKWSVAEEVVAPTRGSRKGGRIIGGDESARFVYAPGKIREGANIKVSVKVNGLPG